METSLQDKHLRLKFLRRRVSAQHWRLWVGILNGSPELTNTTQHGTVDSEDLPSRSHF